MTPVDELTTRFREQGLRVTPQRQVIFRLLDGNAEHPTVEALYEAARTRRIGTEERNVDTVDFGIQAVADDVIALRDPSGRPAALTHWSFEQLATIAGAPPKYLRTLPASIASAAINHGLRRQRREQHQLFADQAAVTITNHRQSCKTEDPAALHNFGYAIDGNHLFAQAIIALVRGLHFLSLLLSHAKPRLELQSAFARNSMSQ